MLAFYSLISTAGLQLPSLVDIFGTHPLQGELRALQESLGAATALLPRDVACARAALKSGLVAQQEGQHWVTHADRDFLIAARLGPTKTLLGVAYRPQLRELAIALLDGGTFVHRGGDKIETPVLGIASPVSNVISTPAEWCHEMDDLVVHLQQTGLGMPLQLIPRGSKDEGSCEALLEVLLGRTDAFLAPPVRFAAEATLPPAALCAFDLLFGEGGGYVSDVYGKSFDVLAEAGAPIYSGASAAPQRGLLACADAMHPYFVRATSVAFPRQKSELQRLSDNLCVKGEYDGPPLRLVDDENSDFESS